MVREERDKYRALLLSGLFHILLLAGLSFTGLFAVITAAEEHPPVDVMLYEEDAAGAAEAAGNAGVQSEAADAGDIAVLPETAALPVIHEEYTRSPEKQQAYKREHGGTESASAAMSKGNGVSVGTGDGSGGANGSGNGAGNGEGHGGGSGAGNGSGNGKDAAAAARAAVAPVLQYRPVPRYPENLRAQDVEGTVVISLIVGADGSVENAVVVNSSGYGEMDAAALSAVQASRYTPAQNVYGEPVRFHKTITVPFHLQD